MLNNLSNLNNFINNNVARAPFQLQQAPQAQVRAQPQPQQQSFGPTRIYNINLIRMSLGCPNLTELEIISMTRDALLHGHKLNDKLIYENMYCHKFVHQKMIFVLSEGFDVVITIIWDTPTPSIIGNYDSNVKAFHSNINCSQNTSIAPPSTNNSNISNYESMIDEECIDEIVNNLILADLEVDTLPPIPTPQSIQITTTNTTTNSTYSYSNQQSNLSFYNNTPPSNVNTPPGNDMENISLNTEIYTPPIQMTNQLWNDINQTFNGHFQNKNELINLIYTAIYTKKVRMEKIENICIWLDSFYVYFTKYISDTNSYLLCDVFDYTMYQNNYAKCINKHTNNITVSTNGHYNNNNNNKNKLVKNSSKRSVISTASTNSSISNSNKEYHTIYLKPIIERMKQITGNQTVIDSDYIISIVDTSIKNGNKRQISKRTFEFKYNKYTIIMSKSLKTILDVTLSDIKDIITVHPDVVSIISKKCPMLDYFTIQKLANKAKLTRTYTTKKNDYRQQFIYDFCGCRIVFASNHTTIVEMQCNQPNLLKLN